MRFVIAAFHCHQVNLGCSGKGFPSAKGVRVHTPAKRLSLDCTDMADSLKGKESLHTHTMSYLATRDFP